MAQKCGHCGSADTVTGMDRVQCLSCGGSTKFKDVESKAPVVNPEPATYHGDDGVTYG